MASTWGYSWGTAWGNSWGGTAVVVVPVPPAGGVSGGPSRGRGSRIEYGYAETSRKRKKAEPAAEIIEVKPVHPAILNGKSLAEYQSAILKQEALERRKMLAAERALDEEEFEALLLCLTL